MTEDPQTGHILFVDDEEAMRDMVQIVLEKDGHTVDVAAGGAAGIALYRQHQYDLVIHDLRMPEMDGIALLRAIKEHDDKVPVVIVTAFSSWDDAVEAMRLGAYDYLKKPFDNDDIRALTERAISFRRMREAASDTGRYRMIDGLKLIGTTPEIQAVISLIRRVAATDSTVVITGSSGTGKEMVARMLHLQSHRRAGPFITVNCGAFSETLLESEIFGHIRGAFTGAISDKQGLLELADGGTFFLDELGEMSQATQIKFLRVLENREFLPVGETKPRRADVRFIAATNRDLEEMVESGTFREDLYFRLNVISIELPPLAERREDIPLLAGHFLATYAKSAKREMSGFTAEAIEELMHQSWPGNIRELQNTIQRAVTLASGTEITVEDIHQRQRLRRRRTDRVLGEGFDLEAELAQVESTYIREALARTDGNLTQAAKLLGITFRSIRHKVKKLDIDK